MRYDVAGENDGLDIGALAQAVEELFAQEPGRLPIEASVSLSFVSRDRIQELNREYRGLDEPTDVLSFPLWEEDGIFLPPEGWEEVPLGDVVICADVVRLGAEADGRDPARELALAAAHGTLHLLGYDHADADEERIMWAAQDKILDIMNEREKK